MEGRIVTRAAGALIVLLALAPAATAQSLDAASAEALAATLRLLQDPTARSAAIAANPQASAADNQIQALAGSANNAPAASAVEVLSTSRRDQARFRMAFPLCVARCCGRRDNWSGV